MSESFTLRRPKGLLASGLFDKIFTIKFNKRCRQFSIAVLKTADIIAYTYKSAIIFNTLRLRYG